MEDNAISNIQIEGRSPVLQLALDALKDAEECYNSTKQRIPPTLIELSVVFYNFLTIRYHDNVTPEIWTQLHSIFGDILVESLELLEDRSCRLIKYETTDRTREIYKIHLKKNEAFTVYKDVNFCQCRQFYSDLLEQHKIVMCKHVLLVKLNEIYPTIDVRLETITGSQFVDFLNEQIHQIEDISDENKS